MITVAIVDAQLGAGWQGTADPDLAVRQANAWLVSRGITEITDDNRADVEYAGAQLAKLAAEGTLYADREARLKRKRVKADTVESEKEYQDGSVPQNGALLFIMDVLRPHLPSGGGNAAFAVRRG